MSSSDLLQLWASCQAFVGDVCRDRDASHGLAHMQTVTEKALLLCSLNNLVVYHPQAEGEAPSPRPPAQQLLARVTLIGMLHDVNDHKYDKDGSLGQAVLAFVRETVAPANFGDLLGLTALDTEGAASLVMLTISAISYSKEKKNGMRWFEQALPREWVVVRDAVSDADKLEAIGGSGLLRSFEYNACMLHESGELAKMMATHDELATRRAIAKDVEEHADDKLLRLKDEYIVTEAGKFLAQQRHDEMIETLADWAVRGPPPLPSFA
jgi:hypothetical protein